MRVQSAQHNSSDRLKGREGLAGAYQEGLVPVMILAKGSGDECSKQAFVPWKKRKSAKAWRTFFLLCEIRMRH
jgi:hypothetical protein